MKWFWDHYLSDPSEGAHPMLRCFARRTCPVCHPLCSSLPNTTRCAKGEFDADKLRAAGVPTNLSRYDGVNHGFMFWVGVVDKAGSAMNEVCDWLRGVFAGPR
jgi:acetyl esterase